MLEQSRKALEEREFEIDRNLEERSSRLKEYESSLSKRELDMNNELSSRKKELDSLETELFEKEHRLKADMEDVTKAKNELDAQAEMNRKKSEENLKLEKMLENIQNMHNTLNERSQKMNSQEFEIIQKMQELNKREQALIDAQKSKKQTDEKKIQQSLDRYRKKAEKTQNPDRKLSEALKDSPLIRDAGKKSEQTSGNTEKKKSRGALFTKEELAIIDRLNKNSKKSKSSEPVIRQEETKAFSEDDLDRIANLIDKL